MRAADLRTARFGSAWQIFGWNVTGTIELNDVSCTENVAIGNGGCFFVAGVGVVNDETVMIGNEGKYGGCICERWGLNLPQSVLRRQEGDGRLLRDLAHCL